jgi:hypothetical protein
MAIPGHAYPAIDFLKYRDYSDKVASISLAMPQVLSCRMQHQYILSHRLFCLIRVIQSQLLQNLSNN